MRLLAAARTWVRQFWDDLMSSTDPGLLGAARFVGLLYGPIDRGVRIDEALRKMLRYRVAKHVGWRHMFGGITYLLLIMLVVTGVLLAFYYRPSAEEAYPSLQYIVSEVSFGWLIRDLHVWAANLIVVAVLAHMARVFFEASYKPPRETNWLIGLVLLGVVLVFGTTGYLLPWDQWSYWSVTEGMDALGAIPILGGTLAGLAMGDTIVSGATLSRFFALHAIVLPWVTLALLIYHFTLVRRRGVAPPVHEVEEESPWRLSAKWTLDATQATEEPGGMPFPFHLLRSFIVAAVVLGVAVTLAVLFPRPMADMADPSVVPDRLVATWVPVDVTIGVIRLAGGWGLALFALVGLAFAALPLFDREPARRPRERPLATTFGVLFFLGFVVLFVIGRSMGGTAPSGVGGEGRAGAAEQVDAGGTANAAGVAP